MINLKDYLIKYYNESLVNDIEFISYNVVKCDPKLSDIIIASVNDEYIPDVIMKELNKIIQSNKIKEYILTRRYINDKNTPDEDCDIKGFIINMSEDGEAEREIFIVTKDTCQKFTNKNLERGFNVNNNLEYRITTDYIKTEDHIKDKFEIPEKDLLKQDMFSSNIFM